MFRTPTAVLPFLFLMALVLGGYLWYLGDLRATAMRASTVESGVAAIGGPFSLIDQDGVRRTDQEFRGKFMLVFFGYTYCPDVCPTTLSILSAALDELGPLADRVVPILVTVDPVRDTPEILKPYLSAFGSRFVGLTGSDEEIAEIAAAYRVYYNVAPDHGSDYTVDHSSVIYLMGPDGAYVANYGLDVGPDAIAEDLTRQLTL